MEKDLKAKIRIHLYTDDKCFGPGICTLLEEVEKNGSLRKAAMSMNMAYSKAWKMIKLCQENLGFELLESTTGGKGGGGAVVTNEKKKFMRSYREYCQEIEDFSKEVLKRKFGNL